MSAPTVLIVDDHDAFRGIARTLLTAEGFEVVGEAADGASALEEARRLAPDLVVLDVQLPDTDGFEVARELAHDPCAPAVVLVSSRSATDYGVRLRQSATLGFLSKDQLSGEALHALMDAPAR